MLISSLTTRLAFAAALLVSVAPVRLAAQQKAPELPAPYASPSSSNNSRAVAPPEGWLPTVADGFKVALYADGFNTARWMAVAPDGDLFVAEELYRAPGAGRGGRGPDGQPLPVPEADLAGDVVVLHPGGDKAGARDVFAQHLNRPFGIAFHDNYVYVAENNEVVRFTYDPKTSKRTGEKEKILDLPPNGEHVTRTIVFAADGKHFFVSVGSNSNYGPADDPRRAAIEIADPDGKNARIYASGLRNAVGLAVNPVTHQLWASVNERDELGDDVPPDYITSVKDGGFYGWPNAYIGPHPDPRVKPVDQAKIDSTIVPDVLLRAHIAPLQFQFYEGKMFPAEYRGSILLAEHGSWNRAIRQGYDLMFIPFKNGKPTGAAPSPLLSGFVPDPGKPEVYGRPVGVAVLPDGSVLVSDDGQPRGCTTCGKIWRISYGK